VQNVGESGSLIPRTMPETVLLQIELRVLRVRVSPLSAPSTSETGAIVSPIIKRLPGKSDAAVSPRTCDKPNSKLLDTPEKVERAGRRQVELEKLVLASGGIAGPGSLGEPAQEESVA